MSQADLFPDATRMQLPSGFDYRDDFISGEEERALLDVFRSLFTDRGTHCPRWRTLHGHGALLLRRTGGKRRNRVESCPAFAPC